MGCFKMKQKCEPKKIASAAYFLGNALLGIHSGSNEGLHWYIWIRPHMFFFDLDLPGL